SSLLGRRDCHGAGMRPEETHHETERFLSLRTVKEFRTMKASWEDFELLVDGGDRGEDLPGGGSREKVVLLGGQDQGRDAEVAHIVRGRLAGEADGGIGGG